MDELHYLLENMESGHIKVKLRLQSLYSNIINHRIILIFFTMAPLEDLLILAPSKLYKSTILRFSAQVKESEHVNWQN
jgi:hypothetical protein